MHMNMGISTHLVELVCILGLRVGGGIDDVALVAVDALGNWTCVVCLAVLHLVRDARQLVSTDVEEVLTHGTSSGSGRGPGPAIGYLGVAF
jgi:hypothetical protein